MQIGHSVSNLRIGDQVVARADAGTGGGLAEYAVAPSAACVPLPEALSMAEGSAISTAGITAWHSLFSTVGLQAGETVLIHAAAGGVGSFAIQFAHRAGARVIATASGDGMSLALELGANEVIDYRLEDFADRERGIDVVLDLVGGQTQERSYAVLRKGGRLVSTVTPPDAEQAAAHGVRADIFYAKPFADRLGDPVATMARQKVGVVLDRTVPFDRFGMKDLRSSWPWRR